MENTDIQKEESTKVVEPVMEETSKVESVTEEIPKVDNSSTTTEPITEEISQVNGEASVTTDEPKEVETVLPTMTEEETAKPIDEQENVTDTNTIVPLSTSLSPGRVNVPLKEVNESEKQEPTVVTNGTENSIGKKRELEHEDEPSEEMTNGTDERNGDQTKKIKTSEATDTPIIEPTETENNIVVNGNTAVEV